MHCVQVHVVCVCVCVLWMSRGVCPIPKCSSSPFVQNVLILVVGLELNAPYKCHQPCECRHQVHPNTKNGSFWLPRADVAAREGISAKEVVIVCV